jgi:hypothetical protein
VAFATQFLRENESITTLTLASSARDDWDTDVMSTAQLFVRAGANTEGGYSEV